MLGTQIRFNPAYSNILRMYELLDASWEKQTSDWCTLSLILQDADEYYVKRRHFSSATVKLYENWSICIAKSWPADKGGGKLLQNLGFQ